MLFYNYSIILLAEYRCIYNRSIHTFLIPQLCFHIFWKNWVSSPHRYLFHKYLLLKFLISRVSLHRFSLDQYFFCLISILWYIEYRSIDFRSITNYFSELVFNPFNYMINTVTLIVDNSWLSILLQLYDKYRYIYCRYFLTIDTSSKSIYSLQLFNKKNIIASMILIIVYKSKSYFFSFP